jgi:hypothetical protein
MSKSTSHIFQYLIIYYYLQLELFLKELFLWKLLYISVTTVKIKKQPLERLAQNTSHLKQPAIHLNNTLCSYLVFLWKIKVNFHYVKYILMKDDEISFQASCKEGKSI